MGMMFTHAAAEPISWRAKERCPHCKPMGGLRPITHLGVGYGVSKKSDGTEETVRLVLAHGCEWHMWAWCKGRLKVP